MAFGAKTLSTFSQITTTPTRASADNLLTDIAAFDGLNQKEKLALRVYCMAKELTNQATNSLALYDPTTEAKILALMQDTKTVVGNIPVGDLETAKLVADWNNSKAVYSALSTDVDTLLGLVSVLDNYTEQQLEAALIYLRLEMGK